jgi:hypothetical protein
MKTYLVSFEPSFPAGLDQRINISRFNSPDMEHFLRTKFCELRERIPALDGVTIYAADDWVSGSGCDTTSELTRLQSTCASLTQPLRSDLQSQRADARFNRSHPVFRGPVEFASFATVLQKALSSCGAPHQVVPWPIANIHSELWFGSRTRAVDADVDRRSVAIRPAGFCECDSCGHHSGISPRTQLPGRHYDKPSCRPLCSAKDTCVRRRLQGERWLGTRNLRPRSVVADESTARQNRRLCGDRPQRVVGSDLDVAEWRARAD